MSGVCDKCGQDMPEPYQAPAKVPPVDPCKALLDSWNTHVNGGMPSHGLAVARDWIAPVLPALRARGGDAPVKLWESCLASWLARQGGRRPNLRWFCRDLPDELTDVRPAEAPKAVRLFPLAKPPVLPVADPSTTDAGLQSVREALAKARGGKR